MKSFWYSLFCALAIGAASCTDRSIQPPAGEASPRSGGTEAGSAGNSRNTGTVEGSENPSHRGRTTGTSGGANGTGKAPSR